MGPAETPPETTPRWNEAALSRAPLYLIAALLLALLAAALTFLYLDDLRQRSLPTAQAAVAVAEIRPGSVITSERVEIRAVPMAMMPEGAATELRNVVGRTTVYPLAAGEVILQRDLVGEEGGGLAARLPDGRWAMVLPTGWLASPLPEVQNGDLIDILAYPPGQSVEDVGLIVERVELVAGAGGEANRVTLAVSLEQATSILYAHVNGFQMLGLLKAQGG